MESFGECKDFYLLLIVKGTKLLRQLLYYPFNVFFVLFGNTIRAPHSQSCDQDVRLLHSTASYYNEMSSAGNTLAGRLENIAHIFASLAELYVREVRKTSSMGMTDTSPPMMNTFFTGETASFSASVPDVPFFGGGDNFSAFEFDFCANSNLLNCFTEPDIVGPNFTPQLDFGEDGSHMSQGGSPHDICQFAQSGVFGSLQKWSAGSKRPLACTFDWFSWDSNILNPVYGGQ
jgi:hypothetical protein